jgi:hypothetical protein
VSISPHRARRGEPRASGRVIAGEVGEDLDVASAADLDGDLPVGSISAWNDFCPGKTSRLHD